MQSVVTLQLVSPSSSSSSGGLGCCQSAPPVNEPTPPVPLSPISTMHPPPRLLSQAHIPTAGSRTPTNVILNLKRLTLIRTKCLNGPTPTTGKAKDEANDPTPAKDTTQTNTDIDMQQFKSVRIEPTGPGKLQKLFIEFYPSHTYKLKVSSSKEAKVWREVFQSYGEYKMFGKAENGTNPSLPSKPDSSSDSSSLSPYYSYTIPTIYSRSLQSIFAYLIHHQAYAREGLFRTGHSSPKLIRQLLLNDGRLDETIGDRSSTDSAPDGSSQLDVHCLSFCAKNLLRCLPESLLTNALMHKIFDAARWNDSSALISLLQFLPPVNYSLLQTLFELLYRTASEPTSRMTAESLTKVVGPNLLPKDDATWIRSMTGPSGNIVDPNEANSLKRTNHGLPGTNQPPTGSIPMQKLFEMIFEHGARIFPSSDVFRKEAPIVRLAYKESPKESEAKSPDHYHINHASSSSLSVLPSPGTAAPPVPSSDALSSSSSISSTSPLAPLFMRNESASVLAIVDELYDTPSMIHRRSAAPTQSNPNGAVAPTVPHATDQVVTAADSTNATVTAASSNNESMPILTSISPSTSSSLSSSSSSAVPSLPSHSVKFSSSTSSSFPSASIFEFGSGRTVPVTPRARAPEQFEREIEREIVIHTFPKFHFEEEQGDEAQEEHKSE